jgi:hypothetical protein
MINIYNSEFTTRIEYILKFVIVEVLSESYKFYTDENQYLEANGPKLNYSNKSIDPNEIRMYNDGFLLETGIRNFEPRISESKDFIKVFTDPYSNNESDENYIDFDLFSSIFYFLTRYEEHLSFRKDRHGRFEANQSYAYKHGFLEKPLVDIYIKFFREKFQSKFPSLNFKSSNFKVIPTIDIDQVFAIKEKSIFRWMLACLKAFASLKFNYLSKLITIKLGNKKDPFDVYDEFEKLHSKYNLTAIYFFLFSKNRTKYDINLPRNNKAFRNLIQKLAVRSTIGIHPSYHSRSNMRVIEEELNALSAVSFQLVDSSRQHFLKMRIPNSYKYLGSIGILNEYTMGYASSPGFRASTTLSFKFYDIEQEQISFLTIHPFSVMDSTFKHYLNYTPSQAFESICKIIDEVKSVNGQFIPLWHNESMSNFAEWEGWQNVYAEVLEYCYR